jgi:hypothetical protein
LCTTETEHYFLAYVLTLLNLFREAVADAVDQARCAGLGLRCVGSPAVWTHVQSRPAAWAEEGRYEGEDDNVDIRIGADLFEGNARGLSCLAIINHNIIIGHWVEDVWFAKVAR